MSGWVDVRLLGDGLGVPCVDGAERGYLSLDAAASTSALPGVAARVQEFLPWYSSVHRGAGWKSQLATAEYEEARGASAFAGRTGTDDVAIICRHTTEAINHLAYRLGLRPDVDVVVTTVVEHHANLFPGPASPGAAKSSATSPAPSGWAPSGPRLTSSPPATARRHRRLQRHRLGPP